METGRWTIVTRLAPARRRACEPFLRARVRVRCVCGFERDIFLQEIQMGRSSGCDSRLCAARYLAAADIRAALSAWATRDQEALVELARHAASAADAAELMRVAGELHRQREAGIDEVITSFLRQPRGPDLFAQASWR